MKKLAASVLVASLAISPVQQAAERPEHFEGKPAETLEQAVENLSEYNARLAAIVDRNELSPAEHAEIHELTYTLENALDRIREEVDAIAQRLETIHVASEERDSGTIRDAAPAYLSVAATLAR